MKDECANPIERLSSLRWKRGNENDDSVSKRKQSDDGSHHNEYEDTDLKNVGYRKKRNSQSPSEKMYNYSYHDNQRNVDQWSSNERDNRACKNDEPNAKQDSLSQKRFFKFVMPDTKYYYQFYFRNEREKQKALNNVRKRTESTDYSDDEQITPVTCDDTGTDISEPAMSDYETGRVVNAPVRGTVNRRLMRRVTANIGASVQNARSDPSLNINADPFIPKDDTAEKSVEGTSGPAMGLRHRRSRLTSKEATTPQLTNDLLSILNQMDEHRMQNTEQPETACTGFSLGKSSSENETETLVSAISMYNQTQASSTSVGPTELKVNSDLNNNPPCSTEKSNSQLLINLPAKLSTRNLSPSQLEEISQRVSQLLMTAVDGDSGIAAPVVNVPCGQTNQPQIPNQYPPTLLMNNTAQYQAQNTENNPSQYHVQPVQNVRQYHSPPQQNANEYHCSTAQNSNPYQQQTSKHQMTNPTQYPIQLIDESDAIHSLDLNVPPPTFQPVGDYQQVDQCSWNQMPSNQIGDWNANAPGSWQNTLGTGSGDNECPTNSVLFEQVHVSNEPNSTMTINVRGDSMMENVQSHSSNISNQSCVQPSPHLMMRVDDANMMTSQAGFQAHPTAGILKTNMPYVSEASINAKNNGATKIIKRVSFSVIAKKIFFY